MTQLYHAFYSEKQKNIRSNLKKTSDFKNNPATNIYKLHNSNQQVRVTEVYSVDEYPDYNNCDIRFNDSIYLGIVDMWISRGD